jgi:hypothetical protein
MNNQNKYSSQYPAGCIQYVFKMHVTHDRPISCKLVHSNVRELFFEKVNPTDEYDPEWRMTIHLGPVHSIEEVDETGNAIKADICDMLSLTLNTKITGIRVAGHGLTPHSDEAGIAHLLLPPFECNATGRVSGFRLSSSNVQEVQDAVSRISISRHKPLISLFRHAIGVDEPIIQFLILYLVLYDLYRNQQEIDRQIMLLEPSTPQSLSPHNEKSETVYTRLRNEIAHRTNIGPETARAEIIDNLYGFRMIVHRILKSMWRGEAPNNGIQRIDDKSVSR